MLSRRILISFLYTLLFSITGWAQQTDAFHPFSNDEAWSYVSSEYFDVYYTAGDKAAASKVARYAELARYELGVLYDYKPTSRYLIVYADDAVKFLETNISRGRGAPQPATFNLPQMTAFILHPGSNEQLFKEVKREVSQLILREFSYGEGLGASIQRQILFSNPRWFSDGLSEYVAGGWSYEDEMWISNIQSDDLLNLALEGDDYANRIVRKSVWRYVAHEYGEQKLSEIIYLVNISHSIESGVISVLGITLGTLTARWREYITTRTSTRSATRMAVKDIPDTEGMTLKSDQELIGFAFNESQNLFAVYLNKQGTHTLELFSPETQKFVSTPIHSGMGSLESIGLNFQYPIAWSQDGSQLATTFYQNKAFYLAYYDLESKTVSSFPIDSAFDKINSINWSHDGQSIVVSALHEGRTDIFTTKAGEATFKSLTDDAFDNLEPVWSLDDQAIFFASNRDTAVLEAASPNWDNYKRTFDLFKIDRSTLALSLEQLTFSPTINERQPQAISSFELGYISDEFGVRNLHKINVFLKKSEPISNLSSGIEYIQASEKWAAMTIPIAGRRKLMWTATRNLNALRAPEPTLLRLEYLAAYRDQLAREEALEKRADEKAAQFEETEVTEPEPEEEELSPAIEAEEKSEKKPVRYYIFDEEDEPYELARPESVVFGVPDASESSVPYANIFGDLSPPKLEAFRVSGDLPAKNVWAADYVGLGVIYDYIPRFGLELNMGFTDLLKNHRIDAVIRPYLNLKNADAQIRYTYQKKRLDIWGEAGIQSRLYRPDNTSATLDTLIFRYDKAQVKVGATYPLSSFLAVEGSAGFYSLSRKDLNLRRPELRDDSDELVSASVAVRYNKTQHTDGFFYKGLAADLSVESMYSLALSDFAFHTARLQLRHYLPVHKQIVLATQVKSAISIAENRQQSYLGGIDDWIVGHFFDPTGGPVIGNNQVSEDLYKFGFQDFITPVRGFSFNSRKGSKYVLMNTELRIPVTRLLKHSLHSGALYNLEIIPFVDAGTIWDQGNPFSQKNPTDTQIVGSPPVTVLLQTLKSPFLFGFGAGVRTNIVGYSIRLDLSWGVDDSTLQQPVLSASMAKNF